MSHDIKSPLWWTLLCSRDVDVNNLGEHQYLADRLKNVVIPAIQDLLKAARAKMPKVGLQQCTLNIIHIRTHYTLVSSHLNNHTWTAEYFLSQCVTDWCSVHVHRMFDKGWQRSKSWLQTVWFSCAKRITRCRDHWAVDTGERRHFNTQNILQRF